MVKLEFNNEIHNKEPCIYCGALRKSNLKRSGEWVCRRHYEQLKKYGELIDNSPYSITDKNNIYIYEDHAEIELRNKNHNIIGYALIDLDDIDRCCIHKWYLDSNGYARTTIENKKVRLHKFLTQTDSNILIDHINRNKLDCRKSNLRIADYTLNNLNRNIQSNNICGEKGVYKTKAGYWIARIKIGDINLCKNFFTKEDAVYQRKQWEKEFHENYNMEVSI